MTKNNLDKKKGGRPSKINAFLEKFKESMKIDEIKQSVIFLTDSELVFLVNEEIEEKDRISQRTFERWKAQNMGTEITDAEELDEVGKEFCRVYKKALLEMKAGLFAKLTSKTEPMWQRWAWILERKFPEWNIRIQGEFKGDEKPNRVIIVKNYKK